MAQAVIWRGTGVLIEQPDSPLWERGDVTRATMKLKGLYALALASMLRKGALGTGAFAGMKVISSTVARERGGVGLLTIVLEGPAPEDDDIILPPDEFECDFGQQELDIKKHPNYAALTAEDLWAVDAFINSADFQTVDFFEWLTEGPNGPAAESLLERLQRGEDHYAIFPPVLRWTSYFLDEPAPNGGGYIEIPPTPSAPTAGWAFLRAGDSISFNGTFWKLTRTWIGSRDWDNEIYPVA